MGSGGGYLVEFSPGLEEEYTGYLEVLEVEEEEQLLTGNTPINIGILSGLLALGLTTNLLAFPVILFKRTRFGNGQFAVLVLVLTMADLLTILVGLVGGLTLEVGHMAWAGDSLGCQLYYFLSSWLLGLANYIVAVLLSLLHVKRSTGFISRLSECRTLLLLLTVASLLPALPELGVHATVPLTNAESICIISVGPLPYVLYTGGKLIALHILPSLAIIASLLRPRTRVAKRLSTIFLGAPATCECAPGGEELNLPHSCPKVVDRCLTPDLVTGLSSSNAKESLVECGIQGGSGTKSKTTTKILATREDPHRRIYKFLLSFVFLAATSLYLAIQIALQVHSLSVSEWGEVQLGADLATALLTPTYLKQILNPLLLLYVEFWHT